MTASEIPWSADSPHLIGFHDRDISMDEGCVERLLAELGVGVRYISGAEYSGYMHAVVDRRRDDKLTLRIDYDPHYCRAFSKKESVWTLHVSDEIRRALGSDVPEKRQIRLPGRTGIHLVDVAAAR